MCLSVKGLAHHLEQINVWMTTAIHIRDDVNDKFPKAVVTPFNGLKIKGIFPCLYLL